MNHTDYKFNENSVEVIIIDSDDECLVNDPLEIEIIPVKNDVQHKKTVSNEFVKVGYEKPVHYKTNQLLNNANTIFQLSNKLDRPAQTDKKQLCQVIVNKPYDNDNLGQTNFVHFLADFGSSNHTNTKKQVCNLKSDLCNVSARLVDKTEKICNKEELNKSGPYYECNQINAKCKPYRCKECDSGFMEESELHKHEQLHTPAEKPFKCTRCHLSFHQAIHLRKHIRSSHEIVCGIPGKLYECNICMKSFTKSYNLRRHERIHSGEFPYECFDCDQKFRQVANLTSHRKRYHGNEDITYQINVQL